MITPYSTPLKTEYKPLGLEAFAQPLSQMSEKLETAKSLAANADFEMSRLNQDDPRSKELMELLEKKRNEIATNLNTSKNYRQATQQIADLNKMFNKDPELQSVKSNYEGYKKMEAEHKAMVEKGTISQKDMDVWKMKTLGEFKGTNYNPENKDYTAISLQPRSKNMEEDMRKESLELARMAVAQQKSDFGDYIETSPGVKTRVETTLEHRNLEQVAGEIQRMLATSDKYKDWVQEDADFTFYANSQGPKGQEFQEGVLEGTVGILKNQIANAPDPKKAAELNAQLNQTMAEIAQAKETGTSSNLAEKYYKNAAYNKFGQLGMAASDLVDFAKLGQKEVEKIDEAAKAGHAAGVKKLEEMTPLTANITSATIQPGISVSGSPTSSAEEEAAYLWNQNTKERLNGTSADEVSILKNIPKIDEISGYNDVRDATKDIHLIDLGLGQLEKGMKEVEDNIKLKQIELGKATTSEDKQLIAHEIDGLKKKKEGVHLSLVNEGKTLENIIERDVANDPEFKELWTTTAKKDVRTFLDLLEKGNLEYLKNASGSIINPNRKLDPLSPEGQLAIEAKGKGLITADMIELPLIYGKEVPKNKLVTFSEKLIKNYNWNLDAQLASATTPLEINGDKSLDTYTGGAVTILDGYIKNNQGGKSRVERVTMSPLTGKTTKNLEQQDFDLSAYNPVWHYAGVNQNEEPVVRYVLDRKFQDVATANSYIASQVRTQKGYAETVAVNAGEVAAWKKANPTDLYIAVPGISNSATIAVPAEKNYVEYSKTALAIGSDKFMENVDNYAKIGLISNPDRRKGYSEMAAILQDAIENKHTTTEIIQGPAAYKENLGKDGRPDGTSSGFVLTYKPEGDNLVMTINKVTLNTANSTPTYEFVGRKTLNPGGNLPTQLYSIDLIYGTGAERDLVHETSNWEERVFVPAFTNPAAALQGLSK
jgi:hypothetical protein